MYLCLDFGLGKRSALGLWLDMKGVTDIANIMCSKDLRIIFLHPKYRDCVPEFNLNLSVIRLTLFRSHVVSPSIGYIESSNFFFSFSFLLGILPSGV